MMGKKDTSKVDNNNLQSSDFSIFTIHMLLIAFTRFEILIICLISRVTLNSHTHPFRIREQLRVQSQRSRLVQLRVAVAF